MRSALSQSLNDSLNVRRSKTTGTIITFIDQSKEPVLPYLVFGGLGLAFGVSIYYFLPMSLLQANFSVIIQIFFLLLLGMLLGLQLLASNL